MTFASLRGGGEHKLKEGDEIFIEIDTTNTAELIFFSDKAQVYKAKVSDFRACESLGAGRYLPARLEMDEGRSAIAMQAYYKEKPLDQIGCLF